MITDNFKYFEDSLPFKEGEFFLVFLHRRKKENPELTGDKIDWGDPNILKGYWFVESAAQLAALKEELIRKSEEFNARVCVVPTPTRYSDLRERTFTCALATHRRGDYLYVVDCDVVDMPHLDDIKSLINAAVPKLDKILYEVPTPSGGCHLVTIPFLLENFKRKYPLIHFGVNRGTILYYNKKD